MGLLRVQRAVAQALNELLAYLAAIDGQSPSNATAGGFAAVITDVHEAQPTLLDRVIASVSPERRIADLDDVSTDTWASLAREGRFPTTFANVTAHVTHAGGVDAAIGIGLVD